MSTGTHEYLEDARNENVLIYVDGEIVRRPEAKVSVFDSGFLLGDGVWEGIRLHSGKLVFLEVHLDRLYSGAEQLAIDIGMSREELTALIHKTLDANGGIRLGTVSVRRGTADTQDPRLNTLSKLNCIAACIEADRLGYDEGLMLDVNGFVSTCNSTNFFIARDGEVWTSTGEYCLPGVTRGNIISLCEENAIPVFQKDFLAEDVHTADEAFVTGTFAGVIPVIEVDGHEMSGGKRGEMTERLQKLYIDLIKRECGSD